MIIAAGTGAELGDYVVGLPIGGGKFGTVCHATHLPTGRPVALKLIRLEQADSDEKVGAEQRGATLQQQFGQVHRNLVPDVYEHGVMGAYYGIAMEFVPGTPLIQLVARGPLAPDRAAAIGRGIARFLDKAHRFRPSIEGMDDKRIVHGDLKPEHVIVLERDEIRVLDFGIAKALEGQSPATTNKWLSIAYASPERLQSDGHVNEHADFWALGVMLFEMVSGFRPYWRLEHSLSRLDRAIRTHEPREPLPPGSDPVLAAVVSKLLAPQIERRYQRAAEIAADLDAFMTGRPTAAAAEETSASQETIRVPLAVPPLPTPAVETEPIPRVAAVMVPPPSTRPPVLAEPPRSLPATMQGSPAGKAVEPVPSSPAATVQKPGGRRKDAQPSFARRVVRFAVAFLIISAAVSETVAMLRAERLRAQIGALEPADLPSIRREYAAIVDWSSLGLAVPLRIRAPLTNRLVDLANRTILDFRSEAPTVAEAQWRQARESLDLARELAPYDRSLAAKRAYVEGQLARISAETSEQRDRAIRHFRESARLDPRQPDPYLGLARVAAYWTRDVEALGQAIAAAEERGYTRGRRESAQFGDVYRALGDRAYAAAMRSRAGERAHDLEQAAAYYDKCIEYFTGLHFYDSETNLRACRRRADAISADRRRLMVPSSPFDPSWLPFTLPQPVPPL